MKSRTKRKAKARVKSSPYRTNTSLVNQWKDFLGLSDTKIAAALPFTCDPSTVSRNITNVNRSQKIQEAIVDVLIRASDGQAQKHQLLIPAFPNPSAIAA